MYMPLRNVCARMLATTEGEDTNIYALVWRGQIAPGTDQVGAVHAISAETGETAWTYEQRAATMSLVATGGGLVFGGDVNGRFRGPVSPGVSRWGREPQRVPGLSQIAAFLGPTWRAVARMLRMMFALPSWHANS